MKEAVEALGQRQREIDQKQDDQSDTLNEIKILLAGLPSMKDQISSMLLILSGGINPAAGLMARVVMLETQRAMAEKRHEDEQAAKEKRFENKAAFNTMAWAAVIGSLVTVVWGIVAKLWK
jgi:chromosome segregation ATPase